MPIPVTGLPSTVDGTFTDVSDQFVTMLGIKISDKRIVVSYRTHVCKISIVRQRYEFFCVGLQKKGKKKVNVTYEKQKGKIRNPPQRQQTW